MEANVVRFCSMIVFLAFAGGVAKANDGPAAIIAVDPGETMSDRDHPLNAILERLIRSAAIDATGALVLTEPLNDPHFLELDSGSYWQISAMGRPPFPSRSLSGRFLAIDCDETGTAPHFHHSSQFPAEPLTIVHRTVRLPESDIDWQFVVARRLVAQDQETASRRAAR